MRMNYQWVLVLYAGARMVSRCGFEEHGYVVPPFDTEDVHQR